jgi:hypothetical protein
MKRFVLFMLCVGNCAAVDAGTLASEALAQTMAATNAGFASYAMWHQHSHPAGFPSNAAPILSWNSNSWFYGKAGLTAMSKCNDGHGAAAYDGQAPITLLTRRHGRTIGHQTCQTVTSHEHSTNTFRAGKHVWFCDTNSIVQTATIARQITRYTENQWDYAIFIFTEDVTNTVESAELVTLSQAELNWPQPANGFRDNFTSCQHSYMTPSFNDGDNTWFGHSFFAGGDSGSASGIATRDRLIYLHNPVGPSATVMAQYVADMRTLCELESLDPDNPKYQLTYADLAPYTPGVPYAGKAGKGCLIISP